MQHIINQITLSGSAPVAMEGTFLSAGVWFLLLPLCLALYPVRVPVNAQTHGARLVALRLNSVFETLVVKKFPSGDCPL